MIGQSKDNLSQWLYQTKAFAFLFFAEASATDMINFSKYVKIPGLLKSTFSNFLPKKDENAPGEADIKKW